MLDAGCWFQNLDRDRDLPIPDSPDRGIVSLASFLYSILKINFSLKNYFPLSRISSFEGKFVLQLQIRFKIFYCPSLADGWFAAAIDIPAWAA